MALGAATPDLGELAREGKIHFMGMGGAGMCALAELLLRGGAGVSGCDLRPGPATDALRALGADVWQGHGPEHLEGAAALVVTAAVPSDHPELSAARALGIPVLKRAQALGAVVNRSRVVGVAGTHGKTSTTAMAIEILVAAGLDPTGLVGGRVQGWTGNLRMGSSDLFVVEADEYDRSFLALEPDVAVVTAVEADHLDTYGDLRGVGEAFSEFATRVPPEGRVVACGDDPGAARLLVDVGGRGYAYGLNPGSQLRAVDVEVSASGSHFEVVEEGRRRGTLRMAVPGVHNVRNALAAVAVARHLDADWDDIRAGLSRYRGVSRRFQLRGEPAGVAVIDDYAHHPTEIEATLGAAARAFPGRRLVAVFQPHLFSRTRDFSEAFGRALAGADVVWVTDVYPAREEPLPGVTGELVAVAARSAGGADVRYVPDLEHLSVELTRSLEVGDVCVIMGAGSVEHVAPELVQGLEERRG